LSGTLITAIGLMPVGFAKSSAGEYAGNIFWIVFIALVISWFVAVAFTRYLGVKLLPNIKPVAGGQLAIYGTRNYRRLRRVIRAAVGNKVKVVIAVAGIFCVAVFGMGYLRQQFFPLSDRPEVFIEIQMPYGTSIERTTAAVEKVEAWLRQQPEAKLVTRYIGAGEAMQPPDVSNELIASLKPVMASLPAGYHIVAGASIEEAGKANVALARVFPVMLVLMLTVIMFQVRSFPAMFIRDKRPRPVQAAVMARALYYHGRKYGAFR
jgi:multidrug efflux pump subunit AcrB